MTTTLVVRFHCGRYRAAPWGREARVGQVEFPPSPWRLLRTLHAVWQTRAPDLDQATAHALLGRLAEAPTYFVPVYTISEDRRGDPGSTSPSAAPSVARTLETYVEVGHNAELGVRWPFDLSAGEHRALSRLAESLPHLGGAVCEARIDHLWRPAKAHQVCEPLDIGESIPVGVSVMTLLAPTLPLDHEALTLRPVDVRAGMPSFARSTQFVGYRRPAPRRRSPAIATDPRPGRIQAVRYTITSHVRPPETDAVILADLLRRAALSRLGHERDTRRDSLLAGKFADERKMTAHPHAHYLAIPGSDKLIDDLVVWVPAGLAGDSDEMAALVAIRSLWSSESVPGPGRVSLRMTGYGTAAEVLGDLVDRDPGATSWMSVTPFIPPGHPKRDRAAFLSREVGRELATRDITTPVIVAERNCDWRSYTRFRPSQRPMRSTADRGAASTGAFLELTFDAPVSGPLALGHLSHFGLGLFRPVRLARGRRTNCGHR
jgi:CRISPR-associated protein Csb2